jgi:hypothetical protein
MMARSFGETSAKEPRFDDGTAWVERSDDHPRAFFLF